MVDWLFTLISWRIDSSWSTDDPAASDLRLYIGTPGIVIAVSTPGPKSVVPAWPTCPLRTASNWSYAYCCRLVPIIHEASLSAAPLPRCGTPSTGPKSSAESKVRWSSVISFCTRHSRSARKVSTLSFSTPLSPSCPILQPWSPNSLRRAVTTRIRRVSGKRPAVCCYGCWNLWGVIQLLTSVIIGYFMYTIIRSWRKAILNSDTSNRAVIIMGFSSCL